MRNNVVIWLTGWDFGTYNNFHRWVARIATLQAVVHSIGYTVLILKGMLRLHEMVITWKNYADRYRGWMDIFCRLVGLLVLVGWRTGMSPNLGRFFLLT